MNIKFIVRYLVLLIVCVGGYADAGKPKVWIISDGVDKRLKGANGKHLTDPDDISAIASYLLMSNHFDTRAIVVGSGFGASMNFVPDQKQWADDLFLKAYLADLPQLNQRVGGYQKTIPFLESFLRKNPVKYDPENTYVSLDSYSTVKELFEEVEQTDSTINVLCWGTLTEPAIFVRHCMTTGRVDLLKKIRFVSHWTNSYFHVGTMDRPENVHNAFNDGDSAAYIKKMALEGWISFFECAAIGQAGIVEGGPQGRAFFDEFNVSRLGSVFVEGKFSKHLKTVDDSDSATYWTLLGNWGVSLHDIASDGSNSPEVEKANEAAFAENSIRMRSELLRRARAASRDLQWNEMLDPELSQFEIFMGVPHSTVEGLPEGTYQSDDVRSGTPMGLNAHVKDIYSMIEMEGSPTLRVSGEIHAGLTTLKSYSNYHISMKFKFGHRKWAPYINKKRDSGLLYHCYGEHGAFWKVWKRCLEFDLKDEMYGDLFCLGGAKPTVQVNEGRYWDPNGTHTAHETKASIDAESPDDEWTQIDLYVIGDSAVHVVNGHVVLALQKAITNEDKVLSEGQIQLQSEGTVCYVQEMRIRPIDSYPTYILEAAGF